MMHLVVDAHKRPSLLNLGELRQYKDLLYILAYRDLRIRYAQTLLGLLWALLQPLATLTIFTIVFGRAVKVDTGDIPYPLFAVTGVAAWTYFAFVMKEAGNSVIAAQQMVKKIYFPRLVVPLSKALVGFVDFGIALFFVAVLMIYYGYMPSSSLIFLPVFVILNLLAALGAGIWLSALTIRYRDFQHIVPFLVQFGLYATPAAYPAKAVLQSLPEWLVTLYYLNPMAGIIEGFRWTLLGGDPPSAFAYLSFGLIFILFFSSLFYFKRVERVMADIV